MKAKLMKFKKKYRKSQPRISGTSREITVSALLPEVEAGLRDISRTEDKSLSWVIAEIICAFFGLDSATGKVLIHQEQVARLTGEKLLPRKRKRA